MSEEPTIPKGPRKITAFQTSTGELFPDRDSATQAEWEYQVQLVLHEMPAESITAYETMLKYIWGQREAFKNALKIAEDGFDAAQFRPAGAAPNEG